MELLGNLVTDETTQQGLVHGVESLKRLAVDVGHDIDVCRLFLLGNETAVHPVCVDRDDPRNRADDVLPAVEKRAPSLRFRETVDEQRLYFSRRCRMSPRRKAIGAECKRDGHTTMRPDRWPQRTPLSPAVPASAAIESTSTSSPPTSFTADTLRACPAGQLEAPTVSSG